MKPYSERIPTAIADGEKLLDGYEIMVVPPHTGGNDTRLTVGITAGEVDLAKALWHEMSRAIFSPVLIWNARHGWVSFWWQGSRGLTSSGLRLDWLGRNLLGQAAWLLPWIWAPLLWQLWRCFRPVAVERDHSGMALVG